MEGNGARFGTRREGVYRGGFADVQAGRSEANCADNFAMGAGSCAVLVLDATGVEVMPSMRPTWARRCVGERCAYLDVIRTASPNYVFDHLRDHIGPESNRRAGSSVAQSRCLHPAIDYAGSRDPVSGRSHLRAPEAPL